MTNDDYGELRLFFADEAGECLEDCRVALAAFAAGEISSISMESVRRNFHNIKGTALSIPGLDAIGEAAALCERVAAALQQGRLAMNPGVLGIVAASCDYLLAQLDRVRQALPLEPMPPELEQKMVFCRERIVQLETTAPTATPLSLDEELRQF